MDGLSSAASVIAVIQLTGSLVKLCGRYIQEVKDARDEIFALQRSIAGLHGALQDLQKFLQNNDGKTLSTSTRLVSNITDCLSDLRALEARLDLGKGKKLMRKVGFRAFKWPLKRTEVEGVTQNLEKYKSLFLLSLQVDQRISELRSSVQKALDHDPTIASKSLGEQFDKLLLRPLLDLDQRGQQPQTAIIVIDALDECDHDEDIRNIILLLSRLQEAKAVRIRVFLTSRPELPINFGFSKIADHDYQDLALHEVPAEVTEHDIHLFLQDRFAKIKNDRNISGVWPGDNIIQELVTMSVPLFISAATVCRYIENSKWEPKLRLAELLSDQAKYVSRMDKTYLPILTRLLHDQEGESEHESEQHQLLQEFHDIVGTIILLADPLSINALSLFLGIGADQISNRLESFRSVLSIPSDCDKPVRTLHLSFRNFLVQSRTKFFVDEPTKHKDLAKLCLKTMRNRLQKDICHLAGFGTRRADIDLEHIRQYLPPELQYSCRYWIHHLEQSRALSSEIEDVLLFLQKHFLHWVEAMSLLDLISEVVGMLDHFRTFIPGDDNSVMSDFLHDAKRFVLKNRQIADEAPLQIYCAGLVFAPRTAIIRREFQSELPSWICQFPKVNETWSAELQALEGHTSPVFSVAFSSGGQLLASGSSDNTVRLWDTVTGGLQRTLKGHTSPVFSVAFSSGGQLLASGSSDNTVRLWDTVTGGLQRTLKGHIDWVKSVAFSPDGGLLASGSSDNTVRLWDTVTGDLQQTLKGHIGWVESVAFSPDGLLVASGSFDQTIRLWDLATGKLQSVLDLEDHSNRVRSAAFPHDGRLLAPGSFDQTMNLCDPATGNFQSILESSWVRSVAFSHDGRLLASGYQDNIVRLWDPATGKLQQTFEGHSDCFSSVTFSSDDILLASSTTRGTVHIWNPAMEALEQTLEGHSSCITSVAFSSKDRLLASGSSDCTVRLWDLATGVFRQDYEGHEETVQTVAFSPNGQLLASGSFDHTVRLWDTATGTLKQTFVGHTDSVESVAFSSDGQLLASGSDDRTIRIWDLATVKLHQTFDSHSDSVLSVAFSPDSRLLASGSSDGVMRLWDTATGALQQTFGTEGRVTELEFSQDGLHLSTNLGSFHIQSKCKSPLSSSPKTNPEAIVVQRDWIILNGKQVLWLPPEVRPSCSAIKTNKIALGHASGRIFFIVFQV
ncbi:hypothetical protein N7460_003731 [Penicillium canescens]|uniref:Nephrocystin 3-like N-terminal domain-containing protein n=2 Tax=Penicillium canescens TaxID=5083 RepID=A0AAD6NB46_PENCN|nr:hypothetical protein N7460_003731 [Penicillium canescens]